MKERPRHTEACRRKEEICNPAFSLLGFTSNDAFAMPGDGSFHRHARTSARPWVNALKEVDRQIKETVPAIAAMDCFGQPALRHRA